MILGILIGSFLGIYVPAYRDGFKTIMGRLAGTKKKPPKKEK